MEAVPYVIQDTIRYGSRTLRDQAQSEILAVLSNVGWKQERKTSAPKESHGLRQGMFQQCTQTVFSVLDTLRAWLVKRIGFERSKKRANHITARDVQYFIQMCRRPKESARKARRGTADDITLSDDSLSDVDLDDIFTVSNKDDSALAKEWLQRDEERINAFFAGIPSRDLVTAAFRCQAYAR